MYGTTKIRTTEEAISAATDRLSSDVKELSIKRDTALSAFRQTATDLDLVNCGLKDRISKFDELAQFIDTQRSTASLMIEDNDAVRKRILDIIGE